MQRLEIDHPTEADTRAIVRIWIEPEGGSIERGVVDVLSEEGAMVRLRDATSLRAGAEVAVRLAYDPRSPTLGLDARARRIVSGHGSSECELEWLPGPDRAHIGSLISALGQGPPVSPALAGGTGRPVMARR
jgi:PilZ domain